ncbi:MAG TPA: hypothetical protein VF940_05115 [Streptosporangiaceae bacterium]
MLKGKNRFRNGATIAAAAAAVVAATAGIAAASVAAPSITSPTTIVLHAHGGSATFVNVAHKTGPAIGDEVILKQPVFNPAHPTVVVGHGFVTVTFLGKNLTQDHATLVLRQGDIDLAGIQASNPFKLAITGGTGLYANARGQATVKLGKGKGNPATITLSLLP